MLREKYKVYVSILSIILSVVLVVGLSFLASNTDVKIVTTNIEEVLDKNKVTKIDIEINESLWESLIENATDEEYVNADITIDDEKFYNIGIRAKGNSSLNSVARNTESDRFSFKIDFSEYVDGQTYHGIEKLALNNMISDASYLKEYLSYDIYNFLGIATPEYSYADISINGESFGFYLALEVMEERFIEKNYGELSGNLYKPESMEIGAGNKEGALNKEEIGNRPEGQMPEKTEGEMPEGFNGEKPEALNSPPIGEGIDANSAASQNIENPQNLGQAPPQMPDDTKESTGQIESDEKSQNVETGDKNALADKGGMGMGGRGSNGGDLKYIDDNPDSYSAIKDNIIFKSTTDEDFEKVIEMIKNLNEGENLEEYLNVEGILKYFAVNTFLVNLDSYSGGMYHNYYLYEKDGVFDILPWDLNTSFAGFGINDSSSAVNFPIDNPVKGSLEDAPLINELLKVDEYKELYHSYLDKIVNEYVNNGTFESTVLKLDKLIDSYVKTDKTAFYTYEDYKAAIPEIITFTKERTTSVKAQLAGEQPTKEYGDVNATANIKLIGDMGQGGGDKDAFKEEGQSLESKRNPSIAAINKTTNASGAISNTKIYAATFGLILILLISAVIYVSRYKRKK